MKKDFQKVVIRFGERSDPKENLSEQILKAIESLGPGESITFGSAWDGERYIAKTKTEVGNFLGEVKRTIAYGPSLADAWVAPQEKSR